jgi:serine/threonine-protein kinase
MGTPYYMSPEQASADREPTPASDVYSLGCVLYEMLVGDPPYTASSAQAVLAKILTAAAPLPREGRPSIPRHVDATIRKAIEKLPADRFQEARGFARALGDVAFRHGDGPASGVEKVATRPGGLMSAMAAIIVLMAAVLAWTGVRLSRSERDINQIARFDLTPTVGEPGGAGASGVVLDISEDGQRIVVASEGADGLGHLFIRSLDALEAEVIPGTEGAVAPALSFDGRVVAFEADGSVHTIALPDGPRFTLGPGAYPAWGDDGALYFERDLRILRVPPGGGQAEPFTESVGIAQMVPDPLPQGRGLLLTVRRSVSTDSRIALVGPEGGALREILDGTQARYLSSGHILYSDAGGTLFAAPFDLETLEPGPGVPVVSGVRVQGNSATQFAVSATGSLVYQTASAQPDDELVWVDRNGAVEPIDPSWVGSMSFPALSPDGSAAVLTFDGDVWVKPLSGGAAVRLTVDAPGVMHPSWTPEGDSILINTDDGLLHRPAEGGGQRALAPDDPLHTVAPSWSPAGEWIVYRTSINREGNGDVVGFRPGLDSVAVSLIATEGSERGPTISPDGKWLAYSSDESGAVEVYVVPFPNVEDGSWLVGEGANPIWSGDGRELYYLRSDELVAVQVRADPTFQILSSSVILTSDVVALSPSLDAPYDVAPDGRFLMTRAVGESGGSRVILIQNLFRLLEEL